MAIDIVRDGCCGNFGSNGGNIFNMRIELTLKTKKNIRKMIDAVQNPVFSIVLDLPGLPSVSSKEYCQ